MAGEQRGGAVTGIVIAVVLVVAAAVVVAVMVTKHQSGKVGPDSCSKPPKKQRISRSISVQSKVQKSKLLTEEPSVDDVEFGAVTVDSHHAEL